MERSAVPEISGVNRTQIIVRLLFTVLFFIVLSIVHFIINLATVFQYVVLLITLKPSEPVRRFANQVAAYGYRVMRYLTLNDNLRPFPFTDLPQDIEPPVSEVKFD